MCDFNRISGLIIGAQSAYLVSLGIVAAVIIFGSNPFTSAANIPAMVIAATAAATAAGLIAGAIVELDHCASGPCAPSVGKLRRSLVALAATFAAYSASLAGLALVAGVPFLGSAVAAALLAWAIMVTTAFAAIATVDFVGAVQDFNTCLRQSDPGRNNDGTTTAIAWLGILVIAVTIVLNGAGIVTGAIPVHFESN